MKVQMLQNVCPSEYGIKGDAGWADAVQYEKGEILDFDYSIAEAMIDNKDAKMLEA